MRAAVIALLALWPGLAVAQEWATRDYCDVELRAVSAEDFAPHDLSELEASAAGIPNGLGRFWRIESPEGAVSHLWGTFHVSTPEILDLPDSVKDAISTARVVGLEIDFTFPDREEFLTQYDTPGRYRDPGDPFAAQDPLDLSFLGPDAEGWVFERLYGWGASEDDLYVLTYAGLAEILLSDPCEDFTGGTIPVQDDFILTLAHIAGVEVVGLEHPDEFLRDLAEDEVTAKAITTVYASYLEPPTDQSSRIAAFQLYLEGQLGFLAALDKAHLARVFGDSGLEALKLTDRYLLDVRNQRFLERALPMLQEGGLFLAVGAAHLPGQSGLVAMLRRLGFDVSRVPVPGELK